jgi:hypothetical protein
MAKQLTPPTKMVFNISVILGVVALLLYCLNVFALFVTPMHLAFWVGIAAWALLTAGVAMKGV